MKINKTIIKSLFILHCFVIQLHAHYEVITTSNQLHTIIKNNPLVIVMMYYKDDTLSTRKMNYAKYSERLFKRTSLKDRYDEAEVVFVQVNIAEKDLASLKQEYGVKKYPTFLLFSNGKAVTDSNGDRVYMQDIPEEEELVAFIERHLRSDIDTIVGNQEFDYYEEDEIEDDEDEYYEYYYPRHYYRRYYYPYYYHPYGYRRYHWWPYYGRRYYRYPRSGFGFHFGW